MAVRSAIVLFFGAAALAAGCQSLVGIEDSPAAPSVGGDASLGGTAGASAGTGGTGGTAGSSGAAGADAAPDAGCNLVHPPEATPGADTGGNIDFVVAMRTIEIGDTVASSGPSWPKAGYDLDKLCTCGTDPAGSCKPPKQLVCDGENGRDNALGAFVYQVATVFKIGDLSSAQLTTKIEAGGNTVLVRVRGYNGTPNDGLVEVTWFASDDFVVSNTAPPKWDGSDEWPVLASSLEPLAPDAGPDAGKDGGKDASGDATTSADAGPGYSLDSGKYVDKVAYVANGTLVANLPQGSFALTASTSINFAAALYTAKIKSLAGGGWALEEGVLAGITKVSDVLGVLPSMDDPFLGLPICTDSLIYNGIKDVICDFPDMTILGTPTKPCDHLSLGITVSGHPAKLGAIIDKPDKPSKCAPGTDPAGDSC